MTIYFCTVALCIVCRVDACRSLEGFGSSITPWLVLCRNGAKKAGWAYLLVVKNCGNGFPLWSVGPYGVRETCGFLNLKKRTKRLFKMR